MKELLIHVQLGWFSRELCWMEKNNGYLLVWVHLCDILDGKIIWMVNIQWISGCQGWRTGGGRHKGSGCDYKGATGAVLVVMEKFWILTGSMSIFWLGYYTIGENCVKGTLCLHVIIITIFEEGYRDYRNLTQSLFFFNWSIVDLQCVNFCCTAKWFTYIFFFIFFFFMVYYRILNIVLWLYSRTLLFIYFVYNCLHLLVPNSWFIPLPPHFPIGNCKFVFYFCESVSLLEISSFVSFFSFRYHI